MLTTGIAIIQFLGIILHVATNQLEFLHVSSNVSQPAEEVGQDGCFSGDATWGKAPMISFAISGDVIFR